MKLRLAALALVLSNLACARPQAFLHAYWGDALYGKGDLGGAVAEYREAVRLAPGWAEAHYALGNALRDAGDRGGCHCRTPRGHSLSARLGRSAQQPWSRISN